MNHLGSGVSLVLARIKTRIIALCASFTLMFVVLAVQNGKGALDVLSFQSLGLPDRIRVAAISFFDLGGFHPSSLFLALVGAVLGGLNIALAYAYIASRKELILRSGLYSGTGLLLALLGIGCAACGTAFLSVIASALGFSSFLGLLPYHGIEIGYMGLFILILATNSLAKKAAAPAVC
jgi:hypothetical protein